MLGMTPELHHGTTSQGAMAARGGLSHLLGTLEDLQRPSSPSGLGPRFSSSSGWILFPELNKVRAIYKPRKPPVKGEGKPPQKRAGPAGPMGLGRPARPTLFQARLGLIFGV